MNDKQQASLPTTMVDDYDNGSCDSGNAISSWRSLHAFLSASMGAAAADSKQYQCSQVKPCDDDKEDATTVVTEANTIYRMHALEQEPTTTTTHVRNANKEVNYVALFCSLLWTVLGLWFMYQLLPAASTDSDFQFQGYMFYPPSAGRSAANPGYAIQSSQICENQCKNNLYSDDTSFGTYMYIPESTYRPNCLCFTNIFCLI